MIIKRGAFTNSVDPDETMLSAILVMVDNIKSYINQDLFDFANGCKPFKVVLEQIKPYQNWNLLFRTTSRNFQNWNIIIPYFRKMRFVVYGSYAM